MCKLVHTTPAFVSEDSCLQSVQDNFIAIFRNCVPKERLALVLRTLREEGGIMVIDVISRTW